MENKTWRLIDTGPGAAPLNMAIDEAIAEFARDGRALPTLRFYGWESPSVSIGAFQKATDINLRHCKGHGISVVRRPTGGRAILHGEELTYSFSSGNKKPFSNNLLETYYLLSTAFQKAFNKIGLHTTIKLNREHGRGTARSPLCFRSTSYGEIVFEGGKIIGSAQKRWNNGFLQQGSIPYIIDKENIGNVFFTDAPDMPGNPSGLRLMLPDFRPQHLKDAIMLSFEETFGVSFLQSSLSRKEILLARRLEAQRYQTR